MRKEINFNELKLMLDNNLFISAKILKALSSYQIVFLDSSGNDHILVKDKNRREARSYKSLDQRWSNDRSWV